MYMYFEKKVLVCCQTRGHVQTVSVTLQRLGFSLRRWTMPLNPTIHEAASFFVNAMPISFVDGAKLLVTALTTMRVGHAATSASPLAAASLGVLTFNVAGNMVITAPLSAMDTIAPQSFGAGNLVGVGLTALRALLTAFAFLLPTAPLWLYSSEILVALGQPPEVAAVARWNMLLLLPGLVPFAIFEVARKFVYAQGLQWPPLPAACVGLVSHALWLEVACALLGEDGAMLAPFFTFSTMALVLVLLIRFRLPATVAAWPRADQRRLLFTDAKAWRHFLVTSVASLLSLTEWLFWEFVCFRAGALGTLPLATYSIGYSLEPCLFMIAIGLSTALTNAVGAHLGAGEVDKARRVTAIGLGVGLLSVCVYAGCAAMARDLLTGCFSQDAAVLAAAADMWPSWSLFLLVSGTFALTLGLVKGLGLQKQMATLVICVLWPVGAPLVWVAQEPAQVWQMLAVTYLLLATAISLCAGCFDWHVLSAKAVELSRSDVAPTAQAASGGGLAAADGAKAALEL